MSEQMYVIQVEAYFVEGVSRGDAETALEPILDVVPFGVHFENRGSGNETRWEVKKVAFVDNLGDFDTRAFKAAAEKVTSDSKVRISGFYYWQMDIEEPTYSLESRPKH